MSAKGAGAALRLGGGAGGGPGALAARRADPGAAGGACRARLAGGVAQCPRPVALLSHDRPVAKAVFSADGRRLFTVTEEEAGKTAHLWDLATGQRLGAPVRAERGFGITPHPDGRRLAVWGE